MAKPCVNEHEINKGVWSKEEDQKLINHVTTHGEGRWHTLPQDAGVCAYMISLFFFLNNFYRIKNQVY